MKTIVSLLCLATVTLCVLSSSVGADSPPIVDEMKALKSSTAHFADTIKAFLASKNANAQVKDQLKDLGAEMGQANQQLAEQMGALGDFLGVPRPPPPPKP